METQTYAHEPGTDPDSGTTGRTKPESLASLLKELKDEMTMLVRQEVLLAKTEVTESAQRIGRNLGYLGVGALVALVGTVFLFVALNEGLERLLIEAGLIEVAEWLAPLIIGVVIGAIGLGLVSKALGTLKRESLKPQQTVNSLREDKEWIKQKAH